MKKISKQLSIKFPNFKKQIKALITQPFEGRIGHKSASKDVSFVEPPIRKEHFEFQSKILKKIKEGQVPGETKIHSDLSSHDLQQEMGLTGNSSSQDQDFQKQESWQYSVSDYLNLDGKTFGAMKVHYKPERARFYISLAYHSPHFDLNRRDIKKISNPFNQRLKVWPVPVGNFEELLGVLRRAEKRAQRHLANPHQALESIVKNSMEKKNPLQENVLSEFEGREIAADFMDKQFGDVHVSQANGQILLQFPYECSGFYKIKENIKRLEGWSYQDKCWRVPFRHADKVKSILDFAVSCQKVESERLKAAEKIGKGQFTRTESTPIEQNQKIDEIHKSVESLKKHIQKKGIYPKTPSHPQGETLLNTMDKKGTGECWVIENDKIWFVRNNGRDSDDWRYNNILTQGGGGAIGFHIPYRQQIVDMLRNAENSGKG